MRYNKDMKILKAEEGMWLTQAELHVGEERMFVSQIRLADGASADEWREATNDEREAFLKAMEEQMMSMTPEQTETEED